MAKVSHTYTDTFFDRDDAYHWLDAHIGEHGSDNWKLVEYTLTLLYQQTGCYLAKARFEKI